MKPGDIVKIISREEAEEFTNEYILNLYPDLWGRSFTVTNVIENGGVQVNYARRRELVISPRYFKPLRLDGLELWKLGDLWIEVDPVNKTVNPEGVFLSREEWMKRKNN